MIRIMEKLGLPWAPLFVETPVCEAQHCAPVRTWIPSFLASEVLDKSQPSKHISNLGATSRQYEILQVDTPIRP